MKDYTIIKFKTYKVTVKAIDENNAIKLGLKKLNEQKENAFVKDSIPFLIENSLIENAIEEKQKEEVQNMMQHQIISSLN